MHTCKFAPVISFSLLLSVLGPIGHAFAQAKSKSTTQDTSNALSGTTSIAAAASTVIDKSYALNAATAADFVDSGFGAPDGSPAIAVGFKATATGQHSTPVTSFPHEISLTLGEYLNMIEEDLPGDVVGIAFQARSYTNGPSYSTPEVNVGFPIGVDVSYQHYMGGLHGDGFGLRYSPGTHAYYSAVRAATAMQRLEIIATRNRILNIATSIRNNTKHDVLEDDLHQYQSFVLPDKNGKTDNETDKTHLQAELVTLHNEVKKEEGTEIGPVYTKANLGLAYAFIAGDTNVSGVSVGNIGVSASQLRPLAKHQDLLRPSLGGGWLVSAQQEFISLGPGTNTSMTRYGLSVALYDKVATQERPQDRWKALLGAEYVFRTVLDHSATYDLFARFRPYYRTPRGGYVPIDITAFSGIGPTGFLFSGFRIGFGFSL